MTIKQTVLQILLVLLAATTMSFAQDIDELKQLMQQRQQRHDALEQAAAQSQTATVLKYQVERGFSGGDAILEAAKIGDNTLQPYLKALAVDKEERTTQNTPEFFAHVALVKYYADEEASTEVYAELDSKDALIQNAAIAKLVLIGDRTANRKLYELLDDTTPRLHPACIGTRSQEVVQNLSQKVENKPRVPKVSANDLDPKLWKTWFEKNKLLDE